MSVERRKLKWIKVMVDDGEDCIGRPIFYEKNRCPVCDYFTWLEPKRCPDCGTKLEG